MKLIVDNSASKFEGLSITHHKELRGLLCYEIDAAAHHFSGGFGSRTKPLIAKDGSFPTGLLYLAKKWLKDNNIACEIVDNRKLPGSQEGSFSFNLGFTPYPEQVAAAEACRKSKRGIITAPTGTGKSVIISLIIKELMVPTLVVVPNVELERQLTDDFKRIFGKNNVGKGKFIYVENIAGLGKSALPRKYDCLILDEFHHSAASTYRTLNKTQWKDIYYRFGVTATPFRSKDEERLLLESILSKVIYSIDYTTAVSKGYIVPLEAYYITVPKQKNNARTWAKMYSDLVVNNDIRNQLIAQILQSFKAENKSTLCLVKEIAHGNTLSKLTSIFFANGQDANSPDLISFFKADKLRHLIGTTGVLGEGVDTKPAEMIIIAGLGKSRNAFHQQIGRGFRRYPGKDSCKVILLLDKSHKWSIEHFKAQCRYLKEDFGIVPTELYLD